MLDSATDVSQFQGLLLLNPPADITEQQARQLSLFEAAYGPVVLVHMPVQVDFESGQVSENRLPVLENWLAGRGLSASPALVAAANSGGVRVRNEQGVPMQQAFPLFPLAQTAGGEPLLLRFAAGIQADAQWKPLLRIAEPTQTIAAPFEASMPINTYGEGAQLAGVQSATGRFVWLASANVLQPVPEQADENFNFLLKVIDQSTALKRIPAFRARPAAAYPEAAVLQPILVWVTSLLTPLLFLLLLKLAKHLPATFRPFPAAVPAAAIWVLAAVALGLLVLAFLKQTAAQWQAPELPPVAAVNKLVFVQGDDSLEIFRHHAAANTGWVVQAAGEEVQPNPFKIVDIINAFARPQLGGLVTRQADEAGYFGLNAQQATEVKLYTKSGSMSSYYLGDFIVEPTFLPQQAPKYFSYIQFLEQPFVWQALQLVGLNAQLDLQFYADRRLLPFMPEAVEEVQWLLPEGNSFGVVRGVNGRWKGTVSGFAPQQQMVEQWVNDIATYELNDKAAPTAPTHAPNLRLLIRTANLPEPLELRVFAERGGLLESSANSGIYYPLPDSTLLRQLFPPQELLAQ